MNYNVTVWLNHSLYPKLRLMPHQVLHPSHLLPNEFDNILKIITSNLHLEPYTDNSSLFGKEFLFWCSFSAFNRNFPHQFPGVICVDIMVPPGSSQIFVYANIFEKLLQDFFFLFSLFVYIFSNSLLIWNFLRFIIRVSGSESMTNHHNWVFLKSSLRFDKIIIYPYITISLNFHYNFVSLYNVHIPTLLL